MVKEKVTIITISRQKQSMAELKIILIDYNKDKLMNDGRLDPLWSNINGG